MEYKRLSKQEFTERIDEFIELFETCFHQKTSEEYLKWRYVENPEGDFFVFVALDDNRIVANYSVSPVRLVRGSDVFKSALSMTTMTHPEYSGKGLFTTLAGLLYEAMEKEKYDAVWGFPNHNSHRNFINKLGWEDIYEIPALRCDSKLIGSRISLEEVPEPVEDNCFEFSYPGTELSSFTKVLKDKKYLQWRYVHNPSHEYKNFVVELNGQVSSYMIFKHYGEMDIDIVDFHSSSAAEGELLLKQLLVYCKSSGAEYINTWMPIHCTSNHLLLEKYGFVNQAPITYFSKRNVNTQAISNVYGEWFIQMGDSDVY